MPLMVGHFVLSLPHDVENNHSNQHKIAAIFNTTSAAYCLLEGEDRAGAYGDERCCFGGSRVYFRSVS